MESGGNFETEVGIEKKLRMKELFMSCILGEAEKDGILAQMGELTLGKRPRWEERMGVDVVLK